MSVLEKGLVEVLSQLYVAPELGEDRLLVRVFGLSSVSVVGVCFLRGQWRGDGAR